MMLRVFTLVIVALAFIYTIEGFSFKPNGRDNFGKTCATLDCGKVKHCQYGFRKVDGCETCKCDDPCNPPGKVTPCGFNKKCYVDTTSTGKFVARCSPIRSRRNQACIQKKAVGTCRDTFQRFYYNSIVGRCEKFVYTGCGGNDNNFQSRRLCETTCRA